MEQSTNEQMNSFLDYIWEAIGYTSDAARLFSDLWNCFPEPVQTILFTFFVLVFGSAFLVKFLKTFV